MSNKQLIRIQKTKPIQIGKYKQWIMSKEYQKMKRNKPKEPKIIDLKPFVTN
jgi:hypothetical protein